MINALFTNNIVLDIDILKNGVRVSHIILITYDKIWIMLYFIAQLLILLISMLLNSSCYCLVKNSFYMKKILKLCNYIFLLKNITYKIVIMENNLNKSPQKD